MDVARPHTTLSPTVDSEVLAILAGTTRPLTGREIARLADRSQRGVLDVLNRLVSRGLVDRQEAGRALLYSLNRDHLAAPAVDVLAGIRAELLRRLRESIDGWDIPPVHASIFGSAARGEGDTESDIDLFVVRPSGVDDDDPRWRDQIDRLAMQVLRWTGNHAGIAEVAEDSVEQLQRAERSVLDELRSDAVVLHGADVAAVLGSVA